MGGCGGGGGGGGERGYVLAQLRRFQPWPTITLFSVNYTLALFTLPFTVGPVATCRLVPIMSA